MITGLSQSIGFSSHVFLRELCLNRAGLCYHLFLITYKIGLPFLIIISSSSRLVTYCILASMRTSFNAFCFSLSVSFSILT